MASTEPTDMQLREIAEADQELSFDMINLIKYRPTAIYESAADNAIGRSGREAYQEYGMVAFPKIIGMGGSLVYKGTCEHQFVGDESQNYDDVIIVRYPSRRAYLEMFNSVEYQQAIKHRIAGLEYRVLHESRSPHIG
ncbi:DUF1330 domain-containing protein [Porticoccaceae bacterium]|nr:DUF1330 domain-containing protein [Porticoccaceae bacterium]